MKDTTGLQQVLQRKVNTFVEKAEIDSVKLSDRLINRHIDDMVIPAGLITFTVLKSSTHGIGVMIPEAPDKVHNLGLSYHAGYQAAASLGVPAGWVANTIRGGKPYEADAVTYALNKYITNREARDNRFLFRNVNDTVRGWLSTSYKRLNTREIFMMFLLMARELKLPLIGAYEGTSKDWLEAIDPNIIFVETPNNGIVSYARGVQLRNSDFGSGKLELRSFKLYPACLNGMTGKSFLKEVHLGSRMSDEFMFSIETINKETEVRALMVRDSMRWIFSERNREFEEAQIVEASAKPLNLSLEIKRLPQLGLVKPEVKTVEEILLQHSEDDGIQGKPSYLMMSQAISAMARDKDEERRRDLQAIAGSYVFTEEPETMN